MAKTAARILITCILLVSLLPANKRVLSIADSGPFVNDVIKGMSYFRIEYDDRALSLSEIEKGNILFTLQINSRRNNFEE